MTNKSNKKKEIILNESSDVSIKVHGVCIEVATDDSVLVYTNGKVRTLPISNDNQQPAVTTGSEPGDKMEDGTIFAGISPDTGELLYVTPQDAPCTLIWKSAMKYAADLDANGHSDWRLPTKAELNVLYENRDKGFLKGTFNETGSLIGGWYWSSNEYSSSVAGIQRFRVVQRGWGFKNDPASVRPVRSAPHPRP